MSKNRRRQYRRRSNLWLLAASGGILLIAAAVLFARNSGGPPASADQGSGGGRIAVDQQRIDYGYVKFGNNESFRIKVTNTGGGTLHFAAKPTIQVLEGC